MELRILRDYATLPYMKQELTAQLDKYRVLSGSALKVIAVVTMLIDHTAAVFRRNSPVVLCFILFMYFLRDHELIRAAVGCGFLSSTWKAGLAYIPIALYNGERGFIRGRVLKYAFYLIYPVHIFILYLLKKALIGY